MCHSKAHSPLRRAAKHKRNRPLALSCDWQCTSSKRCEWSFEGTNWINPVSVVAVAPGQWRDFLGGVFGARPQCIVWVLVNHSCVEAAIETVNSFLNVSLNTRADMLGLIEFGTSQSTQRNKDYQLIFLSLYICLVLLMCPQQGLTVLSCSSFLSFLFNVTVTYHLIFSFLRRFKKKKKNRERIPCWARRTLPMWFKASGHNLLPYWVWVKT